MVRVLREFSHPAIQAIFSHRDNGRHKHNTKHGVKYRTHWFNVFKCPTCGRCFSKRRQPITCTGAPP